MPRDPDVKRKRIEFDSETWHVLHQLSLDSMRSLQELADEAFKDLLKKHHRRVTLRGFAAERADAAGQRPTHGQGA